MESVYIYYADYSRKRTCNIKNHKSTPIHSPSLSHSTNCAPLLTRTPTHTHTHTLTYIHNNYYK